MSAANYERGPRGIPDKSAPVEERNELSDVLVLVGSKSVLDEREVLIARNAPLLSAEMVTVATSDALARFCSASGT